MSKDLSDWGDDNDNGENVSAEERFRRAIDSWIGTIVQLIGVGLLLYAILFDRFKNPALLPGATGLIFLKNVAGRK